MSTNYRGLPLRQKLSQKTEEEIHLIASMWSGIECQLEGLHSEERQQLKDAGLWFSGFYRGSVEAAYLEFIVNGTGEWCQFEGRILDGGDAIAMERNRSLRKEYDKLLNGFMPNGWSMIEFQRMVRAYTYPTRQ